MTWRFSVLCKATVQHSVVCRYCVHNTTCLFMHMCVRVCVCLSVSSGKLQIPADRNKGACSTDQRALHICSPHGAVFPNLIRRACLYVDCQSHACLWRSHPPAEVQTNRQLSKNTELVSTQACCPVCFRECGNVFYVSVSWLEWRAWVCSRELCLCTAFLFLMSPCIEYVQKVQYTWQILCNTFIIHSLLMFKSFLCHCPLY